jgi:hypothetical protein
MTRGGAHVSASDKPAVGTDLVVICERHVRTEVGDGKTITTHVGEALRHQAYHQFG